jgi:uncharacterized cupredoxin-like copper-binding protein
MPSLPLLFALAVAAAALPAWGHADSRTAAAPATKEQKPWGIAGDARAARTIEVRMGDDMRFRPERIEVRQGETIRFVVRNRGKVLHEMVIGTPEELREHAALMKKFPKMEHDEPYMTHVKPGRKGDMVWNFNREGTFQFACLIPGHFDAGMTGTIVVAPAKP